MEANEIKTGNLYFQITRGAAPRIHQFPGDNVLPVLTGNVKEAPRSTENMEKRCESSFCRGYSLVTL